MSEHAAKTTKSASSDTTNQGFDALQDVLLTPSYSFSREIIAQECHGIVVNRRHQLHNVVGTYVRTDEIPEAHHMIANIQSSSAN
jgi:hypothetical protein